MIFRPRNVLFAAIFVIAAVVSANTSAASKTKNLKRVELGTDRLDSELSTVQQIGDLSSDVSLSDEELRGNDGPLCTLIGDEYQRDILLQKGLGEDILEFSILVQGGDSSSTFTVSESSNNSQTLAADGSDTFVSQLTTEIGNYGLVSNFSVEFVFDKCPGVVSYELRVFGDGFMYCRLVVEFIVSGLCVTSPGSNGDIEYMTGRSMDEAASTSLGGDETSASGVSFDTHIVFPDGTSSKMPYSGVYDLSQIEVSPLVNGQQVKYNFTTGACDIGAGRYTGELVLLDDDECQMGFTQNTVGGSWPGVFFGISFEPDSVGDFAFNLFWPDFTKGTQFDEVFETSFSIRVTQ